MQTPCDIPTCCRILRLLVATKRRLLLVVTFLFNLIPETRFRRYSVYRNIKCRSILVALCFRETVVTC